LFKITKPGSCALVEMAIIESGVKGGRIIKLISAGGFTAAYFVV
jgi:hypothetical protein